MGLTIVSYVLLTSALLLVLYRLYQSGALYKISTKEDNPPSFKRKIEIYQRKQQQTHTFVLLILNLLLILSLGLVMVRLIKLENEQERISQMQRMSEKKLELLQEDKQEFLAQFLISNYPEEGIDLKSFDWEGIFEKNNYKAVGQLELALIQKMFPYFGMTTAMVVVDHPTQTLILNLVFDMEDTKKQQEITGNLAPLIVEINDLEFIHQVHVQYKNMEELGVAHHEYYIRETKEKKLEKIENQSEIVSKQMTSKEEKE